jgi:nitrate/TMAO reductase-like tetraheme cytochrome c subunit
MAPSTSAEQASFLQHPLTAATIAFAVIAAALIVYYLVRRPPLSTPVKLLLLAALGIFPLAAAGTGNLAGFEATTTRTFCNGCHVMNPWVDDASDPASTSLAARHGRNALFGDHNCYTCHADYGMFGTVHTKIGGLRHVAAYYGAGYLDMPVDQAIRDIRIYKPFPNATCTHCHSMQAPLWLAVPDHKVMREEGRDVSCASPACHGPAHPHSAAARGELPAPAATPAAPAAAPAPAAPPAAPVADGGTP